MDKKKIAELVGKISTGDRKAETLLFKQLDSQIELIVRRRLNKSVPPADVDDVVSDVKLATLNALREGKFDCDRGFALSTYIVGIAGKQIAQYFRKQKQNREYSQSEFPVVIDNAKPYLDRLVDAEGKERLRRVLSHLKPIHQQALTLRIYQHKSIDDICQILNLDHKQVIDLIHYAQKKIIKKCKNDIFFSIFSILLQI